MATVNKTSDASGKKPQKQEVASSPMQNLSAYFKGIRSEWTKITWPTWPQIWGQTIVVLVMVSIMTLSLFFLDYLLHVIVTTITPHRG
jgi:preprotein translocase subunit SecE